MMYELLNHEHKMSLFKVFIEQWTVNSYIALAIYVQGNSPHDPPDAGTGQSTHMSMLLFYSSD